MTTHTDYLTDLRGQLRDVLGRLHNPPHGAQTVAALLLAHEADGLALAIYRAEMAIAQCDQCGAENLYSVVVEMDRDGAELATVCPCCNQVFTDYATWGELASDAD